MRTYYQGPDVVVNDRVIEIRSPRPQRFLVAKLRDVQVVRTAPDPTALRGSGVSAAALLLVAPALDSPELIIAAVVLGVASPLAAMWSHWRAVRAYELWAWYERHRVQVYSSPDPRVFGQVSRALQRAIEANE
jgi:hypothetical protein